MTEIMPFLENAITLFRWTAPQSSLFYVFAD